MPLTTLRQAPAPKRVLLAEDELMVAHTLRMVLAVDGHAVEIAEDGRQALAMFDNGKHDLVITDFKMPGIDGLELAEEIKKRSPATPVILLTAHVEAIRGIGGHVSNVDVVLGKPCSVLELQAALDKIFTVARSSPSTNCVNPSGVSEGTLFGADLSLQGNTLVVGQNEYTEQTFVFTGNGSNWTQQAKIPGVFRGQVTFDGNTILSAARSPRRPVQKHWRVASVTSVMQAERTPRFGPAGGRTNERAKVKGSTA